MRKSKMLTALIAVAAVILTSAVTPASAARRGVHGEMRPSRLVSPPVWRLLLRHPPARTTTPGTAMADTPGTAMAETMVGAQPIADRAQGSEYQS
jgi:hypothetical protein